LQAHPLGGSRPSVTATLDYWDDPVDFYRVKLARGQRLEALVHSHPAVGLTLWSQGPAAATARHLASVAHTAGSGKKARLVYRARKAGWYDVQLRVGFHGSGRYTLRLSKTG
jgi:hypothetical protein